MDQNSTRAALERLLVAMGEDGARSVLEEVGTPAARAELERVVVLRIALKMLRQKEHRYVIRNRLMSRGVSERTALRRIEEALGMAVTNPAIAPPALAGNTANMPDIAPQDPPCP